MIVFGTHVCLSIREVMSDVPLVVWRLWTSCIPSIYPVMCPWREGGEEGGREEGRGRGGRREGGRREGGEEGGKGIRL